MWNEMVRIKLDWNNLAKNFDEFEYILNKFCINFELILN